MGLSCFNTSIRKFTLSLRQSSRHGLNGRSCGTINYFVMLLAHCLYFAAGMLSLVGTSSESVSQNSSELEGEKESIDSMKKVTGAPASYEAEEFDA